MWTQVGVAMVLFCTGCASTSRVSFAIAPIEPTPLGYGLTERALRDQPVRACFEELAVRLDLSEPINADLHFVVGDGTASLFQIEPANPATAVDATLMKCMQTVTRTWQLEGDGMVDLAVRMIPAKPHAHRPISRRDLVVASDIHP